MSDEMKLLMAICKLLDIEVEIEKDFVFGNQYRVAKRVDESDASLDHMFGDVKTELSFLSVRKEEPVDYIDYKVVLENFLDEHDAYIQFMANINDDNDDSIGWKNLTKLPPESYIDVSFLWDAFAEEAEFWHDIDDDWQAHLKKLKEE